MKTEYMICYAGTEAFRSTSWKETCKDIGQCDGADRALDRVLEISPDGVWTDVSEDAIRAYFSDDEEVPEWAFEGLAKFEKVLRSIQGDMQEQASDDARYGTYDEQVRDTWLAGR